MEKNPVHYSLKVRDINTGEVSEIIPAIHQHACFIKMILGFLDKNLRVQEFDWHFEVGDGVNRSTPEEVREMINYFFKEEDNYGMTVEFLGVSEVTDIPREVVRFSNMGGFPRELFMAKLFTTRNLNRYSESYHMYRKLIGVGVPFPFAVVMGANVHKSVDFRKNTFYVMRGYAKTINEPLHRMSDWRNHAENKHLGCVGLPWGDTSPKGCGGYNRAPRSVEKSLSRKGYSNSKTVRSFLHSIGASGNYLTWEDVMKIAANLTRRKGFINKKEPVKDSTSNLKI